MGLQVSLGRTHSHRWANTNMKLIQLGISKVVKRVLQREKGKGMEVAILAGSLGIGPGNAPAILREEARVARGLGKAGRGQGTVREVRDMVRVGRGQGMVKVVVVRVLGTKVHALIVGRWGTRLQSAYTHELLRRCRSLRLQVPKVR